jgi:2OG-Fe(II) oxygenase superfamily
MKYPHGDIVIKKHRDKEMTSGTSICGISVGTTRKIRFLPTSYINAKNSEGITLNLTHGSLYCMLPPTNDKWTHEILPENKEIGVRYSLTFRNMDINNMIKEIPKKQLCNAILKTGKRKGQECGTDTYYNKEHPFRCGRHIGK